MTGRLRTAVQALWVASGIATVVLTVLAIDRWGGAIDFQWAGSGRRAVELLRGTELEPDKRIEEAKQGLAMGRWVPAAYLLFGVTTGLLVWRRVTRMERWTKSATTGQPVTSRWKRRLTAAAVVAVVAAAVLDWLEDEATWWVIDTIEDSPLATRPPPSLNVPEAHQAIETARRRGGEVDAATHVVLGSAVGKWVLLVGAAAWGSYLLRQPLKPPPGRGRADVRATVARRYRIADGVEPAKGWRPPPTAPARIGISCSGGGVRSAAFCLGALQRLDEPDRGDEPSVLRRAEYLTAVSGGSYLASALAVAEWSGTWPEYDDREGYGRRGSGDVAVGAGCPAFSPGSPEESWFRRNSAYMASDAGEVAGGVMHTLAGLLVNLIILWLLLFVASRPVGWLLSSGAVHPELRAREPSVHVAEQPRRDGAIDVVNVVQLDDQTWEFSFQVPCKRCTGTVEVWRPTLGAATEPEGQPVRLVPLSAGVGRVEEGVISILRQPRLRVSSESQIVPEVAETADPTRDTIVIERQPVVAARGGIALQPGASIEDRLEAALRVTQHPRIRQYSGTTGRPPVELERRDVFLGLLLLGIALFIYLLKTFHDPKGVVAKGIYAFPWSGLYSGAISAAGFGGLLLLLVYLVLPWCVQEVPPWVASTFGGSSVDDPIAGTERGGSSAVVGLLGLFGLSLSSIVLTLGRKLRSKPMLLAKVVAVVLVVGIGFIATISLVQMAAANGPTGRLTGFGLGPRVTEYPDYFKWLAAVAVLGVVTRGDAHSWSIFPYYRRRLSRAFVLHRPTDESAEPLPYEIPVHFRRDAGAGPAPVAPRSATAATATEDEPTPEQVAEEAEEAEQATEDAERAAEGAAPATEQSAEPPAWPIARARPRLEGTTWTGGPELVVCAAANIIDEGVAPPGRRSVSFTFSGSIIGGPEVGWLAMETYLRRLGPRRQRDVTIPAAMAVSGAAVSPAMGKMGLGPLGRLLAILNVRLGVWLPNPSWVAEMDEKKGERWKGRPGWPWFLREVLGRHRVDARYLYVTDGGHWENLGLVELFRRGCTEIYCISAAGDGADSFGTLGEAIALAWEELGVEVDIELEGLRATPTTDDEGRGEAGTGTAGAIERTLRRLVEGKRTAVPIAPLAFAHGTFTYPPDTPGGKRVEGRLHVVEANLTADIPWDVQAHAERWPLFPDDSTADQLFNHRQFESYRRLGHHQVSKLLADLAAARSDP